MQPVVVPIVPAIAIRRILYATDFSSASKKALAVAGAIARRYHSQVYVANVRLPLPYTMATPEAVSVVERQREQESVTAVDRLLHSSELKGVAASALSETGDPAQELKRAVRDHNIDLTVLGTHGRTGLMRLLMGSVAEELLRNLECPVLTVGPRFVSRLAPADRPIPSILYPTDLSFRSKAAFSYAVSLAVEYQAKIVLLHIIAPRNALSSIATETVALARNAIKRMFCSEIDPRCDFQVVVDFGEPAERILACAREFQAGLIALGVKPAGEASTHLRNTVAYRVVLNAECPVLTCR